jgi:hypothetical protein
LESPVVTALNIEETLIPFTQILRVVHVEDVHNHLIDDLCLVICLGVESECVEEPVVLVGDDGLWYPKIDPHSFEEEIGSICCCDVLLAGCEDVHLRKLIKDHKYTIIALLGGWKDRPVIHRDGFPRLIRGRKRGV